MTDLAWRCANCPSTAPNLEALDEHLIAFHPDSEFTMSARLRRAEQERDLAQAELASARTELRLLRATLRREVGRVMDRLQFARGGYIPAGTPGRVDPEDA